MLIVDTRLCLWYHLINELNVSGKAPKVIRDTYRFIKFIFICKINFCV